MMLGMRCRARRDERGFTLIELMVVILIIALLIAIAIPGFLGARRRVQRAQAKGTARNTLTTEQTYYADNDSQIFTEDSAKLIEIEGSISYISGASDDPREASISVSPDGQAMQIAVFSKSGDCFYIHTESPVGTLFYKVQDGGQVACQADHGDPTPGELGW